MDTTPQHKLQCILSQNNQQYHHSQNSLQKQLSITFMETYMQQKQSQINHLQEYLIKEFQNIENSKNRNQKIQRFIQTNLISFVSDLKIFLENIKSWIKPIIKFSCQYFSEIAQKSKSLLMEKQSLIQIQNQTILKLTNEIDKLKLETKQKKLQDLSQFRQKQQKMIEDGKNKQQISKNQWPAFENRLKCNTYLKNQKQYELKSLVDNYSVKKQGQQKKLNNSQSKKYVKSFCKTPNKIEKYQEYYKNVLQNKNTQINYKFERSPMTPMNHNLNQQNKKIPLHSILNIKAQEEQKTRNRKNEIKQKIQKIKIKTELRFTKDFF